MNAKNLASALKNLLLTVTHKLNIHQVQKEYAVSFLKAQFPGNFSGIKITRVTEAEIKAQYIPLNQKTHRILMKQQVKSWILMQVSLVSH